MKLKRAKILQNVQEQKPNAIYLRLTAIQQKTNFLTK